MKISEEFLRKMYVEKRLSAAQIARTLRCSSSRINHYLFKYKISKRTISEGLYARKNPSGDPFLFVEPKTLKDAFLFGLGIGLYWGEGTKRSRWAVRLGNSDPALIKNFILFLEQIYAIDRKRLRFGLQVFGDQDDAVVKQYWQKELRISDAQFYKIIKSEIRGAGTYRNKSKYGVITLYFNNIKLRNFLCSEIEKLQKL